MEEMEEMEAIERIRELSRSYAYSGIDRHRACKLVEHLENKIIEEKSGGGL